MTVLQFDRRATHRIVSEPVCLDIINDVDALAQEAIAYLEPAHLLALQSGDQHLVRGITVAHAKVKAIHAKAHETAALLTESVRVDPYIAINFGPPDAA